LLKKSMDILDVYAWVGKYGDALQGCIIDNIYHHEGYWILKLRCKSGVIHLKVEPSVRIHVSREQLGEKDIDGFTRFLRSRIRDSRIQLVKMPWWERVVLVETGAKGRVLRHYIELIPRGLWVVTDENDRIIYSTRFAEYRDRVIKPSETYKPPPLKGVEPWDAGRLREAISGGKDLVRALVSSWGLPGYIAEELLYRSGLLNEKNRRTSEVPVSDIERLVNEYGALVKEAGNGYGYLVYNEKGELEIYTSYTPLLFREVYGKEVKQVDDVNTAIDVYFAKYEIELRRQRKLEKINSVIEELKARIRSQEELIAKYREEVDELEKLLRLIYENYMEIESILECAQSTRAVKGWDYITRECRNIAGFQMDKGIVEVKVGDTVVKLSIRRSLRDQVLELERKRGEIMRKIETAERILKDMHQQLSDKLTSLRDEELEVVKPSPVFWYERFHWLFTRNGLLAIGGRDQSQNEAIVRKYLEENDVFIHADIHGGSAVVLKSRGMYALEDIYDASIIAACYSKAWKAGFSFIEVFWVPGSQVSKTPPSGEYLPRGAFMVYGSKNYLRIPLELAIGVQVLCDEVYGEYMKIVIGPREVIDARSLAYVVITPGDEDPRDIAEEAKRILEKTVMEYKGARYRFSLDDIVTRIPGPSRIAGYGKGRGTASCESRGEE